MLLLRTGVWGLFIRQAGEVVHAGLQRLCDASALLKGVIPLSGLDLGIVALVNASQHLHPDLRVAALLAEVAKSAHVHHLSVKLWQVDLLTIG